MKHTRVLRVDPRRPDPAAVGEAAAYLAAGGLVAFPTETVYGLGAHALDAEAVRAIFRAKGRPADNPLIVHVHRAELAFQLATEAPEAAQRLAEAFWPGPLTLVLGSSGKVPPVTTGGLDTVAVRVPDHPVALALLEAAGLPVAAPSANLSGRPSPTRAEHVLEDLDGKIDAVLDGGETGVGLESTVVDLTVTPPVILRPGGVSREALEAVIGHVSEARRTLAPGEAPRSPGLKYRHYAPRAKTLVIRGTPGEVAEAVVAVADRLSGRAAFLLADETVEALARRLEGVPARIPPGGSRPGIPEVFSMVFPLGSISAPDEAARRLYHGLRAMDRPGVGLILVQGYDEGGIGRALMDRMRRAASAREVDASALLEGGLYDELLLPDAPGGEHAVWTGGEERDD